MEEKQVLEKGKYAFRNVALYRAGMFGISRINCKTLEISTGLKYAQYEDAIRVVYLEKGKRKPVAFILLYAPWLRVLAMDKAVDPPDLFIREGDVQITKYSSFDPRWETDFEDANQDDIKPLVKFTDIQDGTANHVRMIVNACAANDAKEAGYLADDLLDQLVSRALVVTRRVLPTMEWSVLQDRINELELRASTLTTQLQAAREGKRKVRELIKSALEALP